MLDIKLSYTEGSGRVNRSYRLPENPELVASILRAIKRHGPQEEPEQKMETEDQGLVEPEQKGEKSEREDGHEQDGEAEKPKRPKLYQGFILVRCEACGRITGTCLKKPAYNYHCECGKDVMLEDLISAAFHCPCCDATWTYRTNIADDPLVYNCLNCGAEMQSWWNQKKNRYEFVK